MNPLRQMETET